MRKLSDSKRIVIKVGTSTLTHPTGRLNLRRFHNLVRVLADLSNAGKQLILVSSGAVGLGVGQLGLRERPTDTPTKQACAAVGQCELMHLYDAQFSNYSVNVAQVLLTKAILNSNGGVNAGNCMERLMEFGVIPIVNENDTVAIDELELEIGENDSLAAIVAGLVHADTLILMSDIDGLYSADPHKNKDAEMIPVVYQITEEIESIAGGAGTPNARGGMTTKISAAKMAVNAGIDMVIMNGEKPELLYNLLMNDENIGTRFVADSTK
ncbi:MAG: glutamate 5-kinase [Oscillospiraceae bacterium]|nr:glutamate 5-kinase [Oscillospiraceae bacterium]